MMNWRVRVTSPTDRRPRQLKRLFTMGFALLALTSSAWAHRSATGHASPEGAIVIPSLSHGQMGVIADNRGAIMSLAADQFPTDPTMRRLETFINLQRFACMWGLVPGTLADEESPFNECAHAYLAATRALLVHLQTMPGDRTAVNALVAKIEVEMLGNQASLVLCRYSDEPFNTADYTMPHAGFVPLDPLGVGTIITGLSMAGWLFVGSLKRNLVIRTAASA